MKRQYRMLDGNEAVAYVAYRLNEVIAIYPITFVSHGRTRRCLVSRPRSQYLGNRAHGDGNAIRRGRCRRSARCAHFRVFDHDVHRIARIVVDDPEHVQNCR